MREKNLTIAFELKHVSLAWHSICVVLILTFCPIVGIYRGITCMLQAPLPKCIMPRA